MSLVLDASVVVAWCMRDETSPYADAVLSHLAMSEAVVAPHWDLEVGNALLVAQRLDYWGIFATDHTPGVYRAPPGPGFDVSPIDGTLYADW